MAKSDVTTPSRLSTLRGACLVRDRHRCVVSRKFHLAKFKRRLDRLEQDDQEVRDDEGSVIPVHADQVENLEVAHILPHSLMNADACIQAASRQAALAVLDMFDKGVTTMIAGTDIDRPRNALTLSSTLHAEFGAFKVYFDAVPNQDNTYQIQSFLKPRMNHLLGLPITRTLFVTEDRTIDPPSPRLLAIHSAIANILHLSGAGEYIDGVLYDMGEPVVRADGTSELGRRVQLRIAGWVDGAVC